MRELQHKLHRLRLRLFRGIFIAVYSIDNLLRPSLLLALTCMLSFEHTQCSVLHVPSEYGTIQDALSVVANFDTVLIAPGSYHEFLITQPGQSVIVLGWYAPDTVTEFQTVIDPIPPAEADTPSVFVARGDTVILGNLVFFNRAELRQYDWPTRYGGIYNQSRLLDVSDCRFDSVSGAIVGGSHVRAIRCIFNGCMWANIWPNQSGQIEAIDCVFEGKGLWLVEAFSNSRILNCAFLCNTDHTDLLRISGSDIVVSGCTFGPCYSAFPILRLTTTGGCVIEDCVFEGIERASSIIEVNMDCPGPMETPVTIRRNQFIEYTSVPPASGVRAINLQCQSAQVGFFGVIEDNEFIDGEALTAPTPGIYTNGSVSIMGNTLEDLRPINLPDIATFGSSQNVILARRNLLLPPGLAASTTGSMFDARENWWGDSTGPYHSELNPSGLGSEVGDDVDFIPWLTMHPDSVDTTDIAVDDETRLQPTSYSVSAYPNPFNATTTLQIEVTHAGEYEVMLFDLTGRRVTTLFSGRIESSRSLQISAESLATGVYFAQLRGLGDMLAVTKLLILK